jgi:hypothetical protein
MLISFSLKHLARLPWHLTVLGLNPEVALLCICMPLMCDVGRTVEIYGPLLVYAG